MIVLFVLVLIWIVFIHSTIEYARIKSVSSDEVLHMKMEKKYDLDFVTPLILSQNLSLPILADCIAVRNNSRIDVTAIFSCSNLPSSTWRSIYNNYTLVVNGVEYSNLLQYYGLRDYVQVARYSIPCAENEMKIKLTFRDEKLHINYTVTTSILSMPKKKMKLAVCSYISDYNSINELYSYLAYNKMMGVDRILLYSALELPNVKKAIANSIDNGFVRWYRFSWPLHKYYGQVQYSVQKQQINSCYYRHRHEFEYIVLTDLDEYMISRTYQFDLYSSIKAIDNGTYDVFDVRSSFFLSSSSINREDVLKDGKVFEVYNCPIHNRGRQKMIVNTRSLGFFGMHRCLKCRIIELNRESIYLYHIKNLQNNINTNCINETFGLIKTYRNTLLQLKRENQYNA